MTSGDAEGSPGSLITFLVWEDGAPGRVGNGQVSEVAFAVPARSIGNWLTRAIAHRVPVDGPMREFREPVLRLKDPDGVIIKLVGVDLPASKPWGDAAQAVQRLRAVTTDGGRGPHADRITRSLWSVRIHARGLAAVRRR